MGRKPLVLGQRTSPLGKTITNTIKEWNEKNSISGTSKWLEEIMKQEYFSGGFVMQPLKLRLWRQGESGDGTKLAPYSPAYKKAKKKKYNRGTPTSLHATGRWYDSMFVRFEDTVNRNHIMSVRTLTTAFKEPDKTIALKKKYGVGILQLNEKEQQELADKLAPEFIKRYDLNIEMKL